MKRREKRIFGPVPSRRLGFSLGVDIIPYKTCPLDCVYCQLGRTTDRTILRKSYVPAGEVLTELEEALGRGGKIDWITFSGSGEPTLHSGIGEMIRQVKKMTDIPVAVLTSGTLLCDPFVREKLRTADLVVPDLDAGSERVFRKINRPHPDLDFQEVVEGIAHFVSDFPGRVWLEVMLVRGVNDSPREIERIAALAAKIRPARVQLNTVVRPPAESCAKPLRLSELRAARSLMTGFLKKIPIDIVAAFGKKQGTSTHTGIEARILAYLERRPGTAKDLSVGISVPSRTVISCIARLLARGRVREKKFRGKKYYSVNNSRAPHPANHTGVR
ncbi:MAG: radical SAM protein [Candidatus Aureabacteria bacterium]|nr:radical SAM protein [Candidatus Auribacterota bacterium]